MSDLQDVIAHNAHRAYDQGVTRERERWEAWLARIRTWTLDKSADYQEGALFQQQRIIQLLRAKVTKHNPVLIIDIDELEALISARTHENQEQE